MLWSHSVLKRDQNSSQKCQIKTKPDFSQFSSNDHELVKTKPHVENKTVSWQKPSNYINCQGQRKKSVKKFVLPCLKAWQN